MNWLSDLSQHLYLHILNEESQIGKVDPTVVVLSYLLVHYALQRKKQTNKEGAQERKKKEMKKKERKKKERKKERKKEKKQANR